MPVKLIDGALTVSEKSRVTMFVVRSKSKALRCGLVVSLTYVVTSVAMSAVI